MTVWLGCVATQFHEVISAFGMNQVLPMLSLIRLLTEIRKEMRLLVPQMFGRLEIDYSIAAFCASLLLCCRWLLELVGVWVRLVDSIVIVCGDSG